MTAEIEIPDHVRVASFAEKGLSFCQDPYRFTVKRKRMDDLPTPTVKVTEAQTLPFCSHPTHVRTRPLRKSVGLAIQAPMVSFSH